MSKGYFINETDHGHYFDVSYDPSTKKDQIELDLSVEMTTVYLTESDLILMLDKLRNEK